MRWKSANGQRSGKYSGATPGRKSPPLRSTKMQRRYRASPPKDSGIICRLFSQKRSGMTIRKKIFSLLCSVPLLISGCLRNMGGIISLFSPPNREKPFTIVSNGWPQTITTLPSIHRNCSRQPKAGGYGMKNKGNREETSSRKNRIKYNMYKSKICLE